VPEYWRLDMESREAVVRRDPAGDAYHEVLRLVRGEVIEPLVDAPALAVSALLGRV
jgi:glutaminase